MKVLSNSVAEFPVSLCSVLQNAKTNQHKVSVIERKAHHKETPEYAASQFWFLNLTFTTLHLKSWPWLTQSKTRQEADYSQRKPEGSNRWNDREGWWGVGAIPPRWYAQQVLINGGTHIQMNGKLNELWSTCARIRTRPTGMRTGTGKPKICIFNEQKL